MTFKSTILAFLVLNFAYCIATGYYWKEYFGVIPEDAFVAGKNIDGSNAYVGQAYLKNIGIITGKIIPGIKQMEVPYGGGHTVKKYMKILCGPKENFYWMPTNSTTFHTQVVDKHAVLGGHEDVHSYMNVGRLHRGGDIKIGKINSFWGEAAFHYTEDGTEHRVDSTFEALMYDEDATSIDARTGF